MNWRHKLTLSFIPLIFLFSLLMREEKTQETFKRPVLRRVASVPTGAPQRDQIKEPKRVRSLNNKSLKHSILRNRIPQSLEASFEKDSEIHLTRGYELIKGVVAVPKAKFRSTMGEVLKQDEEFVFFRTDAPEKFIPVALSNSTNTLYPLSSILHVKEATAPVRDSILSKGYPQYYYHPQLKFLSVEARDGQILRSYNDLVRQGYQVELEVLKPSHQPN